MKSHSSGGKQKKPIIQDMVVRKKPSFPEGHSSRIKKQEPKPVSVPISKTRADGAGDSFQKRGQSLFMKRSTMASRMAQKPSVHTASEKAPSFPFASAKKAPSKEKGGGQAQASGGASHTAGKGRWYLGRPFVILYAVASFALFLLLVDTFSGVAVRVTPHQEFFTIDTVLRLASSRTEGIGLETIHIEEQLEGTRPTSGEKHVEEKASGTITIYNEFSSAPQVLVQRTRFETPDGKIYRIAEQITVPGAQVTDGTIEPSSIDVTVYADEPGGEYNIGPADFTIPGFKGGQRYDKFYARSTGPMEGGFTGASKVVLQSDADELSASLESQLTEELLRRVQEKIPLAMTIPEGASRIVVAKKEFSHEVGESADALSLATTLRFDGLAVSFEEIEKELIERYLKEEADDRNTFEIINIRDLAYTAKEVDFSDEKATMSVQGLAHVAWSIDEESLSRQLASSGYRKQLHIFSRYPQIEEAAIIFSPSWWRIFPNSTDKITIERTLFESP